MPAHEFFRGNLGEESSHTTVYLAIGGANIPARVGDYFKKR